MMEIKIFPGEKWVKGIYNGKEIELKWNTEGNNCAWKVNAVNTYKQSEVKI